MIRFRVEGPLVIAPLQGSHGRMIEKTAIAKFWEQNQELADEVGCYVFGMRTGGGLTPIYVGQSKTGFQHECFHYHKLAHYNEALITRSGTPIMFFVVKDSGPQSILETCLNQVEHYLIQLAVQHNPDLANVKKVEWSIPGVFHAGPGQPSASAKALRQILGLVHLVQPSVSKAPDEELTSSPPNEQPPAVDSADEDAGGARVTAGGQLQLKEIEEPANTSEAGRAASSVQPCGSDLADYSVRDPDLSSTGPSMRRIAAKATE